MSRLAYTQIALCVVAAVASAAVSVAVRTHKVCVSPVPPTSPLVDCTKEDPAPDLMRETCYTGEGRVFMRWTDGRWLEVVPKNGR